MINWYLNLSVYMQVLIASLFTWSITSLGSAIVFFFKKVNNNILDAMLGMSAGVMIASSFWSLLNPAIIDAEIIGITPWIVVGFGFLFGGLFLIISDFYFDKIMFKKHIKKNIGIKRSLMLIISITLHNIPEGLAIGVAFGSVASNVSDTSVMAALMLAIGIGIQNFPEGCAISLPLRRENFTRKKSFIYGSLSGIVEPISAILGCILVVYVQNIMPFCLSFAAGAMIYVAISELIPESQKNKNKKLMSLFTLLGFMIMMVLDVALG